MAYFCMPQKQDRRLTPSGRKRTLSKRKLIVVDNVYGAYYYLRNCREYVFIVLRQGHTISCHSRTYPKGHRCGDPGPHCGVTNGLDTSSPRKRGSRALKQRDYGFLFTGVMMIKNIDHINVVVSDLQEAKRFFLDLGFKETISSHLSGEELSRVTGLPNIEAEFVGLSLPGSHMNIELIQYFSPIGGKDPEMSRANQIGFRHIAFEVDDIEAEVERLKANGVQFQSDIQVWGKTGKKLVYYYGPEGIILELAQYPKS